MRRPRNLGSSDSFGDNGFRTDWTTAVLKGVLLPLPLFLWGVWNLLTWSVHWTSRGITFVSYDTSVVLGVVCVKWGVAGALVTWYLLANSPRFDDWIHKLLAGFCGAAILGLVATVVGALI